MTYGTFSFPYNSCNAKELNLINSTDKFCQEEVIVNQQDNNEIKALNLCDDDLDTKLSNLTECKYYSTNEFQNLKQNKNFNIFHNNINGLETKLELYYIIFLQTVFLILM